jgi:hypothetical protein
MNYLICESVIQSERPIFLAGEITTSTVNKCPPLECFIDWLGCMEPYQFNRVFVSDAVIEPLA